MAQRQWRHGTHYLDIAKAKNWVIKCVLSSSNVRNKSQEEKKIILWYPENEVIIALWDFFLEILSAREKSSYVAVQLRTTVRTKIDFHPQVEIFEWDPNFHLSTTPSPNRKTDNMQEPWWKKKLTQHKHLEITVGFWIYCIKSKLPPAFWPPYAPPASIFM